MLDCVTNTIKFFMLTSSQIYSKLAYKYTKISKVKGGKRIFAIWGFN